MTMPFCLLSLSISFWDLFLCVSINFVPTRHIDFRRAQSTRVALGIGLLSGRMQLGGQGGRSFAAYHSPYAPRSSGEQGRGLGRLRARVVWEVSELLHIVEAHISASMSQYTLPGEGGFIPGRKKAGGSVHDVVFLVSCAHDIVNGWSLTLKFCTKATHLLLASKGTASYFELTSDDKLGWDTRLISDADGRTTIR
ncbi:hypothetical protein IW261DRAFT_1425617 [Armillaria novae-zelandiae]|uniref:Uncharacterized protein n=1 Tax=Armillaria novae-zelandiae TaxID=153914 RepID=A0AA39NT21_9AGAR|nr:hypothetical protein IW261DRAFT_1425617 [Armillaria novae-zelandiae]